MSLTHEVKLDASLSFSAGDFEAFKAKLAATPALLDEPFGSGNWLHSAARSGNVEITEWLIEQGQDVNELERIAPHSPPLVFALTREYLEVARVLLENGADPNVDRAVIAPLTCNGGKGKRQLEAIKLLDEFGVDLDEQFMNEFSNTLINAYSVARGNKLHDVVKYLESRGCKPPVGDS